MHKKYVEDCRERAEDPEPYESHISEKLGNLHEGWWNTAVKVENKMREIYGMVYANILRKLNQAQDSKTPTPGYVFSILFVVFIYLHLRNIRPLSAHGVLQN